MTHSAAGNITGLFEIAGTTLRTIPGSTFDLRQGQTVTVTVTGTLATGVQPNRTIANTGSIQWTSLDGADANERTGADGVGGLNDYAASGAVNITTRNIAVIKSIAATSEPHTSGSNLAIGEIVRYRLVTTIPQGTLPNFVVTDQLPNGLLFLDDDTTKVAFVSSTTNSISSDVAAIGSNPWVFGDQTTISSITPAFVLPAARITPATFISGTDPVFSLGTLVNGDLDASSTNLEYVVIEFNALVQNISTNTTNDNGETRGNRFTARVDTDPALTSNQVNVTLREPSIPTVTKALTGTPPVDAFDTATYQISFSNTGSTSAFETRVYDALDAAYFTNVTVTGVTLGATSLVAGTDYTNASGGNILDLTLTNPLVASSPTLVVTFTAALTVAVTPGQTLDNTATVTYTSLPGTGTVGGANITGSSTPGGSGAADGERDGSGGVNDYSVQDTENLTLGQPSLAKSITADSNTHTVIPEVSVGEVITYTLVITVPEGTTPNAVVVDTVTAGLSIIDVVSITPDAAVASSVGYATVETNAEAALVGNQGQLTLNFGTLTNIAVNDGNDETITVVYRAVVRNVNGNDRGAILDNSAVYTWTTGTLTASAADLTVVEPVLSITKNLSPDTGDAGDTIDVTIVVTNPATANDATAFDVELTDLISALAPYATYVGASPPTVVDTGGITGTLSSVDGSGNVTVTYDVFPIGATSTITFQIHLEASVAPGQVLTNEADVQWTSMPGDPGQQSPNDTLSVERTGDPADPGGAENDHNAPASDTVTIPNPNLVKSIIATSEAHTASTDLAVGEIIRYRMFGTIVEGTLDSLILRDALPAGLAMLNDGEIYFGLISDDAMTVAGDLSGANFSPLPPTFAFPTSRITANGSPLTGDLVVSGQNLAFDFGTIVNNDRDANAEYGVLEFNALVLNTADNVDGATKSNAFQLDFIVGGTPGTVTTAPVVSTILEPSITDLQKNIVGASPVDAGDSVTYRITYSNTGSTTAFDVRIEDVLDSTRFDNVTVTSVSAPSAYTDNTSGNTVDVVVSSVPGAGSVSIEYTATLKVATEPNETIGNTVDLTYTSLPGTGTTGNPTGTNTPGASGDTDGERNGSGTDQNSYNDTASQDFTTGTPALAKSIVATNQTHTSGNNVAVGEIITYQLVVTVPEGTTPNMVIRDTLDAGLGLIDPTDLTGVVTLTASAGVSLASTDPNTVTAIPGGAGSSIQFNLGTVTNSNTNDAVDETITITYQVVVLNQAAVNRGTTGNNSAVLTCDNSITLTAAASDVTVVEPTLEVIKSNSSPATAQAGDLVEFQLTIQHAATSDAAALDVVLSDPLASTANYLSYAGSVIVDSGPAPTVDATGGDLTLTWSQFGLGSVTVLRIQAVLDDDAPYLTTLTNTAGLTWTSIAGDPGQQSSSADSTERTGSGVGPNDYLTSDSGDAETVGPAIDKAVTDTSETSTGSSFHTGSVDLAIGETVTFDVTLTLPDGRADDFVVSDLLPTDPPGTLEMVSTSIVAIGQDFFTDVAHSNALVSADIAINATGNLVTFAFPTAFYNRPDTGGTVAADNQITLRVVARLINAAGNQNGDTLTNEAILQHTVEGATNTLSDTETVDVVEPDLNITKTAAATAPSPNGGDSVTFTITVDHTASSTADAFDVIVTDTLPNGLVYANNVIAGAGTPTPFVSVVGQIIFFYWDELLLGDGPYSFTFEAAIDSSVTDDTTLVNPAVLEYDSLAADNDPNERSYTDTDSAPITISVTAQDAAKSLVTTSEGHTSGSTVAVGEIVRYRLQFQITGGTIPDVQVLDQVPPGMQFLNDGTALVAFVGNPATNITSSNGALSGAGLQVDGDATTVASITPTFVLPAGTISDGPGGDGSFTDGGDVIFQLGDILNNDGDADLEYVVIEFNALVLNVIGNQQTTTLSNSFRVYSGAPTTGALLDSDGPVTVTVAEPIIADVTKTPTAVTSDGMTFQVQFSNTGDATAFDVLVADTLPAALSLTVGSIAVSSGTFTPTWDASASTAAALNVVIASIPAGDSVTVTYTTTIVDLTATAITNAADVTYTSLPDARGTLSNPTGSETPGASGTGTGERDGSNGPGNVLNNYADADDAILGSIGDYVWDDFNSDGVQDGGESGIRNVTLVLTWPGPDGDFTTPGDNVTRTTDTDANGNYLFNGLPFPGTYRVTVDTATLPLGVTATWDLDSGLVFPDDTADAALTIGNSDRRDVDFGYAMTEVLINDDCGDFLNESSDNWLGSNLCTAFLGNCTSWIEPGDGSEYFTWVFHAVLPGTYRVSATWVSAPEWVTVRASNAPFTIRDPNGTSGPASFSVDQTENPQTEYDNGNPDYFFANGTYWYELATAAAPYTVTGDTLTVTLTNLANNYVVADGIRIQRISAVAPSPAPPEDQQDGAGVTISLADARIMDNGDPGYSSFGQFANRLGTALDNDYQVANTTICGNSIATWQFNGLTPGVVYRAYATWTPSSTLDAEATYRLYGDDVTPINMQDRATRNQQIAPNDLIVNGVGWELLGSVVSKNGVVGVELTNAGHKQVMADGILLAPVVPSSTPDIALSFNGQTFESGTAAFDFGTTEWGVPVIKTFTVQNVGIGPLVLQPAITTPAGFSASCPVSSVLEPGESTSLTVAYAALTPGRQAGTVSISSNDPDESPFTFLVSGQVPAPAPGPVMSQLSVAGPPATELPRGVTINAVTVQQLLPQAIQRWSQAGVPAGDLTELESLTVEVASLTSTEISRVTTTGLRLDNDAGGYGWFVDASGWEDAEFVKGTAPVGIDLLTVVMHELGHHLGFADLNPATHPAALMSLTNVASSTRRVPSGNLLTGQNPVLPEDIDGNGIVTPVDALYLINHINAGGQPLWRVEPDKASVFMDPSGDGRLTPTDVLRVINYLNALAAAARGEGESGHDDWEDTLDAIAVERERVEQLSQLF